MARVMITNCLGISQRAEMGMEVGTVTPTEVVKPAHHDSESPLVACTTNPLPWDPSVVLGDSDHTEVLKVTSKSKVVWRK